ncbi:unnamed protein product [Cyprideis torosa]|uniref:Elongin-B n=1 Tax=Cyprideis torosa TaxID=163714 RepID=A0A7R8WBH3_9CRUS|nr:unnamed protein product [Cyprideis torosa]CAG0892256.1 unnamed protein product [Cyprideis torosa]
MEVFLMIRRHKTTIFTDAKENTTVRELKKIVHGILKVSPEDQRLYKEEQLMDDSKQLSEYGLDHTIAKAQAPATVGLAIKQENGEWEALKIDPLSDPPPLPDIMKRADETNHEQSVS